MIYYFYNTKYVVTEIYYTKPTEDKLKEPHIVSELSFSNKYGYTLKLSVDIVQNKINAIYEKIETEEEKIYDKISILEAENEKLKVEQEQQNEEILVNMLANTEMFEMILGMMPAETNTKNNGGNSMIEVYCTLIIKGVKTIEDVPLVLREQVIERLKQLEVPVK